VPKPWEPRGKQAEFEAVVLEHFHTLYSTALRLTRNPSEAQDLVQETLLKAYRFFDRFEPGTNVKAWLFTILRNTYINTYRKTVRQQEQVDFERIEPFYADTANDPEWEWTDQEALEAMLRYLVQDDVKRALDALPEVYRIVVLLADLAELPYKDIAAIIGCPEGTVMSRLFRGRRLLRKSLQEFARKSGYVKG
jgi:RNA polymerase sigma-70 factor (ECF subfamily)